MRSSGALAAAPAGFLYLDASEWRNGLFGSLNWGEQGNALIEAGCRGLYLFPGV